MTTPDDLGAVTTGSPSAVSPRQARFAAPFSAASRKIDTAVHGAANLVKLEIVVTIVCVFIPLLLLWGDG